MRRDSVRLLGRQAECAALDRLLQAVRGGESQVLVVQGEPGAGKTALLDYLAAEASDGKVTRTAGNQSDMEFAFGGLHQLCAPILDHLAALPVPQREALRTTFGLSAGPVPDRFLLGLGTLSLLAEAAATRPLICLIDDAQWLDRASAQIVAFVARRLGSESVGLVFAARTRMAELASLPELRLTGLADADARELLNSALTGRLDEQIREQIIAEARGNPLALLELPRGLTAAELAGGFGLPGAPALPDSVEESFRQRFDALPADTRALVLLAAADPSGEPGLVWRAARQLGIGAASASPATEAGLIEFGDRMRFRHPLVRSAAYQSASMLERFQIHGALAEATDPETDPDRRAWHRAHAAGGSNEDTAVELENSAQRAQQRGGVSAAAAFLERAAALTPDPVARAGRTVAAAQAKVQAGASAAALALLTAAEAGPLSDRDRAQAKLVRAQAAFAANRGGEAPLLLREAARQLEAIDPALSRATYLDAMLAAGFAGRLAGPGGNLEDVARAAATVPPPPGPPGAADLLLDAMTALYSQGYTAALPLIRAALTAMEGYRPAPSELSWLSTVYGLACHIWDDERCVSVAQRYIRLTRETGTLTEVPLALIAGLDTSLFTGDLPAAASLIEEFNAATAATGSKLAPYAALQLAALHGDQAEVLVLIEPAVADAASRGEGFAISAAQWAGALLYNSLGRYREALAAAQRARSFRSELGVSQWALVEFIEAAACSGSAEAARRAYDTLAEMTGASGTDWALGLRARSHALLSDDEAAENSYRESIERLGCTRMRTDLARAQLLYGEWLLRHGSQADARSRLRTARDMLEDMGMAGFAGRATDGLLATGEQVRKRAIATAVTLTAQEAQIARLARDGLSNPEIGARLFISARTVQYHLTKVFTKLGISSRGELGQMLPAGRYRYPTYEMGHD
jgi:DNA-binding CsgD family transcriptional regulator